MAPQKPPLQHSVRPRQQRPGPPTADQLRVAQQMGITVSKDIAAYELSALTTQRYNAVSQEVWDRLHYGDVVEIGNSLYQVTNFTQQGKIILNPVTIQRDKGRVVLKRGGRHMLKQPYDLRDTTALTSAELAARCQA